MQRLALVKIIRRGPTIITHNLLTNKLATTEMPITREHLSSIDLPEFIKNKSNERRNYHV